RPRDNAHQTARRGPLKLPFREGGPLQVAPLRTRRVRAGRAAARPAARQVRLPGGRQPAAGGPRPAGGLDGRDPRRRQGGLPAERDLAHADHRPRRAEREQQGDPLRRQGHQEHAAGDGRNRTPSQAARGIQQGTQHHARDDQKSDPCRHRGHGRRPRQGERRRGPQRRDAVHHRGVHQR
ncbi:unnamed protein product, partial [Ectocarpus sp. 4 AP-2014]